MILDEAPATSTVALARRPLIGITGHATETATGYRVVAAGAAYVEAVRAAGGLPVVLAPTDDQAQIAALLDSVDGLLFTGGKDVDPRHYGEPTLYGSVSPEPERDAFELPLAELAVQRDVPLLAICRGCQVLNVALGGTLWQDLPAQRPENLPHYQRVARNVATHPVQIERVSLLGELAWRFGNGLVETNSFHHQAAREVPAALLPVAFAADGTVEAIEAPGRRFVLGVQWHPEHLAPERPEHQQLFAALVAHAAAAAGRGRTVDGGR